MKLSLRLAILLIIAAASLWYYKDRQDKNFRRTVLITLAEIPGRLADAELKLTKARIDLDGGFNRRRAEIYARYPGLKHRPTEMAALDVERKNKEREISELKPEEALSAFMRIDPKRIKSAERRAKKRRA